jgi:lipopolysaccharide transport system ATP-binding protein
LGENFTALRDLVPAMARSFGRRAWKQSDDSLDFWALKDICLEVRKGEALGVIGHNGSGKSTMLKHFAGIMTPTKGRITVNGRLSALIEVGAGFHPDLTGRENVFLSGVILGMSRAEVSRKFDQIVEFAGLTPFIDTPVKRYSSGMYARLGFSVAAHLDPDILVIDEVLSVGDFVFRRKSLQKMRSVVNAGATVIFVSHNLKAVSDLCSRTILLDAGSIVADGPTSDVIQTYLARERAKIDEARDSEVVIQSVTLRGVNGTKVSFSPGEKAWVDVTLGANQACENIAVALAVANEAMNVVFNTSSQRLEDITFSLQQGETATLTFELTMHLAVGTFHLAVILFRYDLDRELDRVAPAATFCVESEVDVRGAANLYPKIVECSTL